MVTLLFWMFARCSVWILRCCEIFSVVSWVVTLLFQMGGRVFGVAKALLRVARVF